MDCVLYMYNVVENNNYEPWKVVKTLFQLLSTCQKFQLQTIINSKKVLDEGKKNEIIGEKKCSTLVVCNIVARNKQYQYI